MFCFKDIKTIKSFFNKFVKDKNTTNLKIECTQNILTSTLQFNLLGVVIKLKGIGDDFDPIQVKFSKWYNTIQSIKKVSDIEIKREKDMLNIYGNQIPIEKECKKNTLIWEDVFSNDLETFTNAFLISSVAAKKGLFNCNKNIFFNVKDNHLSFLNTNDIILHENKMDVESYTNFSFGIDNIYVSIIKKWLQALSKGDEISFSKIDCGTSFGKFSIIMGDLIFELIFPIKKGEEVDNTYHYLKKILDTPYTGKEVDFDNDTILLDTLQKETLLFVKNPKKKKSDAMSLLQTFTIYKDTCQKLKKKETYSEKMLQDMENQKKDLFKNINKYLDISYLSLESYLEPSLCIAKTLYQDYISMTNDFDATCLYLDTESKALFYSFEDDMFEYKTLFMLRKQDEMIVSKTNNHIDMDDDTDEEKSFDVT